MPTISKYMQLVAQRMMLGPQHKKEPGTPALREAFRRRHEKQLYWITKTLYFHPPSVGAVVGKCLVKYDPKRVGEFVYALRNCNFQGPMDPVYLLWRFLESRRGKGIGRRPVETYRYTLCAARAYMERRTLVRLTPARTDLFKWGADFSIPPEYNDWNPDAVPWEVGDDAGKVRPSEKTHAH